MGKKCSILGVFLMVCFLLKAQTKEEPILPIVPIVPIVLNHFLVVVDTGTYQAILNSEILNSNFSYAYEKDENWEGIYIIGQDNYIEILHPQSIKNETMPVGFSWVCHTSLQANYIEKLDLQGSKMMDYSSDKEYDYLSFYTQDSSNLFTTWEMNKWQYESWTQKEYHDSLIFQTVDYNSPAESDSAKNYVFKNVSGIRVRLPSTEALNVSNYLTTLGYTVVSDNPNILKYANAIDFIELEFSSSREPATVSTIYFDLLTESEPKQILIGKSELFIQGNTGKWELHK